MDAQSPRSDDVSDLETRLAGWRPDAAGLDPDAMLFAAGRASVRPGPGRFVWPSLAGCFALVAVMLGAWGMNERSERQSLARLLVQPAPPASEGPVPSAPVSPEAASPDSYLAVTRLIGQDADTWLARTPAFSTAMEPAAAASSILRPWPLKP